MVPAPKADKSHLNQYSAYRYLTNEAPVFQSGASIDVNYRSADSARLTYSTASDDDMVWYYRLRIKRDGTTVYSADSLVPYYDYPNPADMPSSRSIDIYNFPIAYPFTVEITAVDVWGAESAVLSKEFVSNETGDQAKADAVIAGINSVATVTKESLELIIGVRAQYNQLSYQQKQLVTNYQVLLDAESTLYNTFYVTRDAEKYGVGTLDLYSLAPTQSKGSFALSQNTGVTLTWNNAANNQAIGLYRAVSLDGLHLSMANLSFTSEDKVLGWIISGAAKDKHTGGDSLLVYIDFEKGVLYVGNGLTGTELLRSELMVYDNFMTAPFSVLFAKSETGFTFTFETVSGSVTAEIPAAAVTGAANLADTEKCYISVTPWSGGVSAQVDIISLHDGVCVEDEVPVDPVDPGQTDPGTRSCGSSAWLPAGVLAAVAAVALISSRRRPRGR